MVIRQFSNSVLRQFGSAVFDGYIRFYVYTAVETPSPHKKNKSKNESTLFYDSTHTAEIILTSQFGNSAIRQVGNSVIRQIESGVLDGYIRYYGNTAVETSPPIPHKKIQKAKLQYLSV